MSDLNKKIRNKEVTNSTIKLKLYLINNATYTEASRLNS
jgi:hypothetical protein